MIDSRSHALFFRCGGYLSSTGRDSVALSKHTIRRIINEESKLLMRKSKEETALEEALSMYHQLFESVNPTWRVILEGEEVDPMNEDDMPGEGFINRAYRGGSIGRPRQDDGEREEREPARDVPRDAPHPDVELDDTRAIRRRDRKPEPQEEIDMEEAEKTLMAKFRDSEMVDLGLGLLGAVGGYVAGLATAGSMGLGAPLAYTVAALPDLINSARFAARGQRMEALVAFLSALPIIGEVLGPARISLRLFGGVDKTMKIIGLLKKIRTAKQVIQGTHKIKTCTDKIIDFCEEYMPEFNVKQVVGDVETVLDGTDEEVEELVRSDMGDRDTLTVKRGGEADDSEEAAPISEGRTFNIIMETSRSRRFQR